jgi:hypothetical protein
MKYSDDIHRRLETGARILEIISRRRMETGCRRLGWAIERALVDWELEELEDDLLQDPPSTADKPAVTGKRVRRLGRFMGLDLL